MIRISTLLLCIGMSACVTTVPADRSEPAFVPTSTTAMGSLFSSDAAVLSDADIARILDHEYSPPTESRIAVLPVGWQTWSGWSSTMASAVADVDTRVLATLTTSPGVSSASFLPELLIPEKKSVPYLREAAARFQADLMMAFQPSCQSFQRFRLFQSEQTRAYCTVEAVLLDVRTGLVPYVAAATEDFEAEQSDADLSFQETILNAQLRALEVALVDVSESVADFVSSARQL